MCHDLTKTLLTALLLAPLAALHAADKPNLVIIFTDDMGYADIGAYGCEDIPTPHLDRLAAEGTRFTSAYTVAPICVPSRMGLMSGKFPARFGVFNNVYAPEQNQLWMQQTTLADVLRTCGYRTANVGKWHLSGNDITDTDDDLGGFHFKPPHERGFDEFVGITGGMHTFWKGTELARLKDGKYERFKSPDYLTDFFGTEACEFIHRNKANPFFLYLAFNAPHAPLHGLDEDQAAVSAKDISPDRRTYAAMVRAVDRNVGRVMDKLRERGLADNTLIVFTNDNGGGGNNAAVHTRNTAINRPYRGHKFDVLEGGVRVPFIMRWPGQVPAGQTFDGIVSTVDVFPTFAKVANATVPGNLDGVDLMPYLTGEKTGHPHETLCWQQQVWIRPNERKPHPAYPVPAYNLAIRSGKWKAIKLDQPFDGTDDSRAQELYPDKVYPTQARVEKAGPGDSRSWELYDLSRDPAELNDLATEFPDKAKELSEAFFAWQKQIPKPVPMHVSGAVSPRQVVNKLDKPSLLPANWDPALAGDIVMQRLVKVTAPQVKGAHDAEFVCVGDHAYIVASANDVQPGENPEWPFMYVTMSIVNLKSLKPEKVIAFAKSAQAFENRTLPAGACIVPRIIRKDAGMLRCYFDSNNPGERQSQVWYRDFDSGRHEFAPTIHKAKLKTAAGTFDFQPQHLHADAAAQGFTRVANDSTIHIFDSFKRFDGRIYVALNNFRGKHNALALVHDDLETFEVLGHFNQPESAALSESAVNRLPDGTWMAVIRSDIPVRDGGNYHFATSRDGRTWTAGRQMPHVPNGLGSKPTFDRFGDIYYLGWQESTRIKDASDRFVNRSVFNVDVSRDGRTWERKYRFETPQSFQYPTFHEHEGAIWLCVTQGDTDPSRKERIMFGKLEDVGHSETQEGKKRKPLTER